MVTTPTPVDLPRGKANSVLSPAFVAALPLLFVLSLHAAPLQAQQAASLPGCEQPLPPARGDYSFVREREPLRLPGGPYRIGSLRYTRLPVFDTSDANENTWIYRLANRVHVLSREGSIAQQLLFASEENFDPRVLEETQRLLRNQGYLFDADIRPFRVCGDRVDLEVITRDSWNLTPSLGFDRSGGENSFSLGISDTNVLGLGNEIRLRSSNDIDRRSAEFLYLDNNVWGSRVGTRVELLDSDDGFTRSFQLGQPFFELDSRKAWRVALERHERIDELFLRGEEVAGVVHEREDYAVEMGTSKGLVAGFSRRWSYGYGFRRDRFAESERLPLPRQRPTARVLSFPYLRFEAIEDRYVTALNLNQIYLTEDLQVGSQLRLSLGLAAEAFGSDQDRWVLEGSFSDTLLYDGRQLWQHSVSMDGFWNHDLAALEDFVLHYDNRYFHRQNQRFAFFAELSATASRNLNSNRQLFMGGYAGGRAFSNRLQAGDRRFVFSLEERYYSDLHLFNLVRVGAAVFVDVGRAWQPGVDDGLADDYLANVGVGLRLGSSKSASARMAHIDFALPLTNRDDPAVDGFALSIEFKSAF